MADLNDTQRLEQLARAVMVDLTKARGLAYEIVAKIDLDREDPTEPPIWEALYTSRCHLCRQTIGEGWDQVTIFEGKVVHEYCAEERRAELEQAEAGLVGEKGSASR